MNKNEIEYFPEEIIEKMLYYQEKQGNPKNITIFQNNRNSSKALKGFDWYNTLEGSAFWCKIVYSEQFDVFFNKYSKKENSVSEYKMRKYLLYELYDSESCEEWRKNIKEILQNNILVPDTQDITIDVFYINLLGTKGTPSQIAKVKNCGIVLKKDDNAIKKLSRKETTEVSAHLRGLSNILFDSHYKIELSKLSATSFGKEELYERALYISDSYDVILHKTHNNAGTIIEFKKKDL